MGSNARMAHQASRTLDSIVIKGAREHNLKNVDLVLPRNNLIVITGLSGSGKSSLAFDTIYAEGQRRYVESLSSYARQFLGQMEKPDVDYIEGLSPAISIDQKSTSRNPRSTVGTVTEIYDYMRLLYARIGKPHCYNCGKEVSAQSSDQIVDQIMALPEGTRIQLLAPVIRGRKGEYAKLFEEIGKEGFARVRVDGEIKELREKIELDKKKKHTVEVVVDRLVMKPDIRKRLADSVETTSRLSTGIVTVLYLLVRIIILEFMDAWNFDVRTVKKTCVHIVSKDLKIIPFETMNIFYRDPEKLARLEELRAERLGII